MQHVEIIPQQAVAYGACHEGVLKMSEQERTDAYTWFKARQEIFLDEPMCTILPAFEYSMRVQKALFPIRTVLTERLSRETSELGDTLLFYLDMTIEDYESIILLSSRGFFSTPTALLRRMFVGLGWVNYLWKHPEQCEIVRSGTKIKDSKLIEMLPDSEAKQAKEFYSFLCESSHVNFDWAQKALVSRPLDQPSTQNYVVIEANLNSADQCALSTARTAICIIGDTIGDLSAADRLREIINPLIKEFRERSRELFEKARDIAPDSE